MEGRLTAIELGGGYSARPISYAEYRSACIHLEHHIFSGNSLYAFSPTSRDIPPLGETFTYGLFYDKGLIGWSHSQQSDQRTVYMADTGILPVHQGQGLYTRLLPHLLDVFRAAGYTLVQSHHRATNNRVIVPKLRAGFHLQGFNLYEGGLNVALTLGLRDAYSEAQHIRSGFKQAGGAAGERLGLRAQAQPSPPRPTPHAALPPLQGTPVDLGGGYELWPVPYDTYWAIYAPLEDAAYHSVSFEWAHPAALPAPEQRRYTWLITYAGQVAGWQYSRQWDSRTAYMVNTALLPEHRGQGLYSRVLPIVLYALKAEGYDLVRSHHHATNNAVLVPKLRAGFRIQGLQVDEHGVMAILNYSFDPIYNEYMDVRSGLTQPTGEVAARLGLQAE